MKKTKFEISAGGLVFKRIEKEIWVCLIATNEGSVWQLPKGLVEKGEPLEATAVREVKEETGLQARVVTRLDKIDYWYYWQDEGEKVRRHKIVYFSLMEYEKGDTSQHDFEVDEARWFSLEEAEKIVSYKNEREVIRKAREFLHADKRPPE